MMIPQTFHWVWIGSEPIPDKDIAWMKSWLIHNPGWGGVLWMEHPKNYPAQTISGVAGPEDIQRASINSLVDVKPLPPLVNQRFYDGIEQWVTGRAVLAARSDIVRYEIIARYGGVYLDTDVEALQPLGGILQEVRLFVADEWGPGEGNFMFGGVPNHPALWTVVRELGPWLASNKTALNAVVATGPNYLNPRLRQHPDLVIFPHMLFNPLCAYDDPAQVEKWPTVSIANHHYAGKWYDRIKNVPPLEFRRPRHRQ